MRFLSPARFFPTFLFTALLLAACQLCFAQSPPPPRKTPPLHPPPAATDQEQFISYWTTETGWRTELQLRNNQATQSLTVTPVLRTPDGTETSLSPVSVNPQEAKSIDLDTAIGTSAPQAVGTYGSVVLRYHSATYSNLYAVAMIHSTGHSIAFHIDGMSEFQDFQAGGREGIWWLPSNSANDYLILTNQGASSMPLDLSLFDANGKASTQKVILSPRATSRLSVRQLVTAAGLTGSYGGIKISAAEHAGSLDTLHVLFDQKAGFSAVMKMFDYNPTAQIKERDYAKTGAWTLRAPMLALSSPDPALAFPVGTTLHPQLFVRNTTAKPIDAALLFNWRSDSATGKSSGPALRLNPYETRRIDVAALQDGKTLPQDAHWTSVTLTTKGLPDEVMAVAASYDKSLQYGAQTPFSDQLAFHWMGSKWEYDPYHDSIITVGNGGTKPTRAAFTIFYNQGTQKYELEQTLQPDEQMWIDVGKLIRENVPDKNGKGLPADLTSGSYEIRELTHKGVGTLFEGKVIYDKTYGHVTYGCGPCCGYKLFKFYFDPLGIPFTGTAPQTVEGLDTCYGQYLDITSDFDGSWSTASTAVARVDAYGVHTGIAVGSTTSQAYAQEQMWGRVQCPIVNVTPGGGDNVADIFTVSYAAYIPVDHITSASSCTWNGPGGISRQVPFIYIGDANRGTYRAAEEVQVLPDLQRLNYFFNDTGQSRNYGYRSPANGSTLSSQDEDGIANDCYLWNNAAHVSQPFNFNLSYPAAHKENVHYTGSAYNPLESSLATITWDITTAIDATNATAPTATVTYNHTCYPAHQIKVNGAIVYLYTPPSNSAQQLFNCLLLHNNMVTGATQPTSVPAY